jgi:hypothetical protein
MADKKIFDYSLKVTPVGSDELELQETTDGVSKKLTLAGVIAALVNGVYQPLAAVLTNTTASFTSTLKTKLDGVEALADVTDTANVTAAGALMDSEVDADLKTFVLPADTTISAFGKTLVDDADAPTARATLGAGTGDGDVSAAAVMTDNTLVKADGGGKGVQDSGIVVTDTDTVYGANAEIVNITAEYTFALGDEGKSFICDGTFDIIIPAEGVVDFPVGAYFNIYNVGSGTVTLVLNTDTLLPAATPTDIITVATPKKTASVKWMVVGDLG